jgi:hypothetical protein
MGISTDAILFYGYCWDQELTQVINGGEEREDQLRDDDWPKIILLRRGLKDPWEGYPHEEVEAAVRSKEGGTGGLEGWQERQKRGKEITHRWCQEHKAELDAWTVAKDAVQEEFGCEIHYHCHSEYPMPYVCVEASRVRALRGRPEKLTVFEVPEDWDGKLERFCKELGIEPPQEVPEWWLVSYWS